METLEYNCFELHIVKEKGCFSVTSPYFKEGINTIPRKTKIGAVKQGKCLVDCIYRYSDIRDMVLNDKGRKAIWTPING